MNDHFCYPGIEPYDGAGDNPTIDRIACRDPESCAAYVSLQGYEDDCTVLKNPHKGWFWHYIDNGFFRPQYRAGHDPDDHLLDFPGLNHLYLRYDWGDIDQVEGHPDFSPLERIMDDWGRFGYTFSMRICTYEGSPLNPFATPEYVYKAGAKGRLLKNGCLEPDYGDPVFLEKLEAFLEQAGRRFNGDPRIELIDLGTFGTWGEGHTGVGSNIIYPASVIQKHMNLHRKYFPDTFLLLNDDHINAAWTGRSEEENIALIRSARTLGLGLQDDSVFVKPYAVANGYTTLRTPWLFDLFWENAPTVLEFEHYHMIAPEHFRQGLPFLEAMRRTHCTFAGFHGDPRPWLNREPYFTEYCANRLGYWYFLKGYELPVVQSGTMNLLRLWVENRGVAPAYHPYTLKVRLRGESGRFEESFDAGNTAWASGQTSRLLLRLHPQELAAGSYGLYVGLFEKDRPVRFAFDSSRQQDGFCWLGNVQVL